MRAQRSPPAPFFVRQHYQFYVDSMTTALFCLSVVAILFSTKHRLCIVDGAEAAQNQRSATTSNKHQITTGNSSNAASLNPFQQPHHLTKEERPPSSSPIDDEMRTLTTSNEDERWSQASSSSPPPWNNVRKKGANDDDTTNNSRHKIRKRRKKQGQHSGDEHSKAAANEDDNEVDGSAEREEDHDERFAQNQRQLQQRWGKQQAATVDAAKTLRKRRHSSNVHKHAKNDDERFSASRCCDDCKCGSEKSESENDDVDDADEMRTRRKVQHRTIVNPGRWREVPSTYRLHDDLLRYYRKAVRPVTHPSKIVTVTMSVFLYQIIKLDAVKNTISLSGSFELYWQDEFLQWEPEKYEGATEIFLPSRDIWIPEFSLYYSVNFNEAVKLQSNNDVRVNYTGHTRYYVPFSTESLCNSVDVKFFPFDIQGCTLLFGSWSHSNDSVKYDLFTPKLSLIDFYDNQEWQLDLNRSYIKADGFLYDYLDPPLYWDMIQMDLVIARQSFYYVFNLVLPSGIITAVAVIGFHTPGTSGRVRDAKYRLGIMTLMSMSMILIAIVEDMPKFSLSNNRRVRGSFSGVPLIGLYYFMLLTIVSMSTVTSSLLVFVERSVRFHGKIPWYLRWLMWYERSQKKLQRKLSGKSYKKVSAKELRRPLLPAGQLRYSSAPKSAMNSTKMRYLPPTAATNVNGFVSCGRHNRLPHLHNGCSPVFGGRESLPAAENGVNSVMMTGLEDKTAADKRNELHEKQRLQQQLASLRSAAAPDSPSAAAGEWQKAVQRRRIRNSRHLGYAIRSRDEAGEELLGKDEGGGAQKQANPVVTDENCWTNAVGGGGGGSIDLLHFPAIDASGYSGMVNGNGGGGGGGDQQNAERNPPRQQQHSVFFLDLDADDDDEEEDDHGLEDLVNLINQKNQRGSSHQQPKQQEQKRGGLWQHYESLMLYQCIQRALDELITGITSIETAVRGIRDEMGSMITSRIREEQEGEWQRAIRRLELLSLGFYISLLLVTMVLFFYHDWYCTIGHNPCGQPNLKCPWLPRLDPTSPVCQQ